ncbi:MAG: Verru_Chthon cassette protein A, partial [Verrucomicrobiota bacterium]
ATQTNPIIGRVAYWTDDETCKVNVNTASEGVYWDKPYGVNREDSGLSGDPTGILGYSTSVPVQDEFQRLPGHPAFTSLSAVFGGWLPRPDIGFSSTDSANGAAAYTGGTYAGNILPYYQLTPRIGDGGTQGGTRDVLNLATAGNKVTLDSDRLYASSDEFLYGPTVSGGIRAINNLSLPADQIRKTGFFVTATSKAPETTLFEQPRISLWPLQQTAATRNVKDKLLAFASTTTNNSFPYYFQRVSEWASDDIPGSSQSTTADVTQARNDALLKYLLNATQQQVPGFGAALSDKYKNGTLPQILVEMFDTVRSLVNTTSRALSPSYSYAPYGPSGSANNPIGLGTVVPARTTLGGTEVKGIGRFPTITEVVIVFMATGWKDTTTLGAAPLFTPTPGGDGLPDDVADDAGKYNGVGDPQTTGIRAFVFLVTINPVPGQPDMAPAVRYQIEGLDNFQVTSGSSTVNLGFPSKDNATLITRSNSKRSTQPEFGIENQMMFGFGNGDATYARSAGNSTGVTLTTANNDAGLQVFPFIGSSVPLESPAQPGRFGLDSSGNYTDLRPSVTPTTMAFSGGTLKIRVFPGTGNTFAANDYIQEIDVSFPPSTLPVPFITRSTFAAGDAGGPDFDSAIMETDRTKAAFYAGFSGTDGDSRDFDKRLHCYKGNPYGWVGATNPPVVIRRGDVMRSVYLDPAGPARGDVRVLAGLRNVPSSFFTAFPGYTNASLMQACGAAARPSGTYRSSLAYSNTLNTTNPGGWTRQQNRPLTEFLGKLVNLTFTGALGNAPLGMTSATLSGGNPGDWNTGVGSIFDGPYINLGEQGFSSDPNGKNAEYFNVYFPANNTDITSTASITSFSPNRQVSSPVLFGSLPSGITPLSSVGATGTQAPWQTLLFCPNPPAKNNHPGLAVVGTVGPGPNARPPFPTAPDHLFLDNFWMPVVEPYAISEPFST